MTACGSQGLDPGAVPPPVSKPLVVRFLDVGQGDAIVIENGASRVIVDGGPSSGTFGRALDSLGLNGARFTAVILSHEHFDHYAGLRALFASSRRIVIDAFFENGNPALNSSLIELRDSIRARVSRQEMMLHDTDDPCGSGARMCTLVLDGGARLEILRPDHQGNSPNNRSVAIKLLGPDSTSFSMWLAGDAEHEAIEYFDIAGYDETPGMSARIMKANHHGSCNGITARYLDMVRPDAIVMSLSSTNDFGFVHEQTVELLRSRMIPWYRTDVNGTITIVSSGLPGSTYSISTQRGMASQAGDADRAASPSTCANT
ncbi:MAG: hypothetical protein MNPFHGCM_00274 [Gemmatimonadaceae bacterium]|nr:hypothetical protein [Gemmatimonadaceae bacterium]